MTTIAATRPTPAQVARAFLTPRPPAMAAVLDLPGSRSIRVTTPGGELAAVLAGEGPAALLVHGWEGQASDLAEMARALLRAGLAVVAVDLPAHGRSSGRSTSIPAAAQALLHAAPAFGPLQAVVAHSIGTAVALTAMARGLAPRRAAFLAAPAHYADYARAFAAQAGLDEAGTMRMLRHLLEEGVDVDAISAPALARTLRQPALYVHSADDRVVPIRDAEAASNAWPGATLLRVDGLGHRRLLTDAKVIAAVVDFVAAAGARHQGRFDVVSDAG